MIGRSTLKDIPIRHNESLKVPNKPQSINRIKIQDEEESHAAFSDSVNDKPSIPTKESAVKILQSRQPEPVAGAKEPGDVAIRPLKGLQKLSAMDTKQDPVEERPMIVQPISKPIVAPSTRVKQDKPETPTEPKESHLHQIMKSIQSELCAIRSRQLCTLQHLGTVKADLMRVKRSVNTSKWFTDALLQGVNSAESTDESLKCLETGDQSLLELFKRSANKNSYEDESYTAIALYDYEAADSDEIAFDSDDIITDIEMIDNGWWLGSCHGKKGLFPANYVILQ